MRLTSGGGYSSTSASTTDGRLEIYAGGQWGTVCDDSFGQREANVACNQLGFASATSFDDVVSTYVCSHTLHCMHYVLIYENVNLKKKSRYSKSIINWRFLSV